MTSAYSSEKKVAAVIVGGDLNGLGVVRSIARQQIPIVAVDTLSSRAALWSRHARSRLVRSLSGPEFVEDIIQLGREFDHPPVLLLTSEDTVHSVSENRGELSKWFRFRLPADANVKILSSKASFHDFSRRHDFPVPHTVILESKSDIGLLDQLRFPCVMKPDNKLSVLSGHKERAVRVGSLGDARERANAMLATPGGSSCRNGLKARKAIFTSRCSTEVPTGTWWPFLRDASLPATLAMSAVQRYALLHRRRVQALNR